jgi:hypothetical protein
MFDKACLKGREVSLFAKSPDKVRKGTGVHFSEP